MNLDALSRDALDFYVPRFELQIDDQKVPVALATSLVQLTVEEKIDEGASFSLVILDEFDLATQQFRWLDHPILAVGNRVSIKMGYGSTLRPMTIGRITSIEPNFFSGEAPTLTVQGHDLSFDFFKLSSEERSFANQKYSTIAETLAKQAGLNPVVEETSVTHALVCKKNDDTYYTFLESLAGEVGYQFWMDGRNMYFVKPKENQAPILKLEFGKDLVSFTPRLKTTGLVAEVEVRGHNPKDPAHPIVGRATAGSERAQETGKKTASQLVQDHKKAAKKVIANVPVSSVEEANAVALSELNKASDTLIEGEAECIGLPQIRVGTTVELGKMGKRFSGKYYVKSAKHTIGETGYRTSFSVKRNSL